ncbi:MAG: acyl-CoA/acyl-ACP dehydrogenase [Deltaproteobacteria bacterium]|nr:acyl-CoA/acyl-ACP dehydrogenase [Deltaproteobacteria bacterium]MBW2384503.1 acyl-CoA/acyl-ACP dehydrogenase [Deltaproteobacteria bacterium]
MDFQFNDEQEELRSIARAFLEEHCGSEQVRKAMESELGFDAALWQQIGAELGWTSVHIPESYGGLGLGYVELVALMEIMGEVLVCAPFFSSIALGANALIEAGTEAQQQEHLPGIAGGATRATLAFAGQSGRADADAIGVRARRDGDDYVLDGIHSFVLDGHSADLVIVAARAEGSTGGDGVSLFALPGGHAGLARRPLPTMDQTRRLAELTFSSARVPAAALMGEEGGAWPALSRTLQLACVALAAEQVGGAQRCLDSSVAYACEREQFGRPIGSFQAIKHKCADMMVEVESARSAAYYAGCVAAERSDELAACASLAKAYCSDAYFRCAADAIQIHGGVGFTWEYDCHLHLKRAKSSESFLGEPAYHRELVAQEIGL